MNVLSPRVSSISQQAHIVYSGEVHKSDLAKNEACKMQLVFWRLFEVEGDPSSYCSYLDTIRGCWAVSQCAD